MANDRSLIERQIERVEVRPFTLEGFHGRRERKARNRRVGTGLVALALVATLVGGLAGALGSNVVTPSDPRSAFVGTWVTTEADGSSPTMTIGAFADGAVEIVVHDDLASVCSGAPSTMTGTGRPEGAGELVIPSPVLTCDDGSEPEALSGPPLEEQLQNMTFVHDPEADTLRDNLGLVWERAGADDATLSGGMWPQSNMEEVREAQRLADEGDLRYTWQVDPHLYALTGPEGGEGGPYQAEIFARFLREELGWQEFRGTPFVGSASVEGHHEDVAFVRCAPGRTNPLYPNDPEGRGCAPTIGERRYETVQIDVKQLDRRGPSGVWVVTGWAILPPSAEPITPNSDLWGRQVEQVVPPTDAEITGLLEAFLQARIDGEGAQEYLHSLYTPADEIPLLYATTSGAPYERSEIERLDGPVWPIGDVNVELRLFADGGNTVVEQRFTLYREGKLGLQYFGEGTTENGKVVPEPSSILDGQVIFSAAYPPWYDESGLPEVGFLVARDIAGAYFQVLPNSLPPDDCATSGRTTPSAEALVRAIRSDPDLEATAPVPDRVAGIDALRLDVAVVPGAATCPNGNVPVAPSPYGGAGFGLLEPGARARLYVLDLPEGIRIPSESGPAEPARTLTILITAPEAAFDRAVRAAAPILDSFEFHPR